MICALHDAHRQSDCRQERAQACHGESIGPGRKPDHAASVHRRVAELPVFRPLIGFDSRRIIDLSP